MPSSPFPPDADALGNFGRYLRVDLTACKAEFVPIPTAVLRQFLGGSGLGTALLLLEKAAALDALDPASPLVFAFSPLVGSPLTTSAKFAVVSKSPLTHRLNDSLVSSGFAIAGKKCGCDAILLVGKAAEPSVLVIDEGQVRLDPVGDLAGQTCSETERKLADRYPSAFRFAVIGPAGENRVRYATISHDGRHAGRGGSGAVLGSKHLKAVAVRGTRTCTWADPTRLAHFAKDLSQRSFGAATAKYRELGTASNLLVFNRLKTLPTRNFQAGSFEGAEALAPETLSVERQRTRHSCVACTIGCEHIYSRKPGPDGTGANPTDKGVRLEYESLFALGPLCDIRDPDVVLAASQLCDDWGLDTISTGGTIAFAMECVERGWLDQPWLRFGNGESLLRAIELIGSRAGIGGWLAEGSRHLANRLGPEAVAIAPQVKGLELPGYEPRALQTMAVGFATGSRGADHNRSGAYQVDFSERVDRRALSPEAARLAVETENHAALMDSLILCKFLRGVFADFYVEAAEMLRLIAGWDVTADELHATAQRIVTARKLFNIHAGWQPDEDTLPERFLTDAPSDDPRSRITRSQLQAGIRVYNETRGWSGEGWPPDEEIREIERALMGSARKHAP